MSKAQLSSLGHALKEEKASRGQAEKQLESAGCQFMQHCKQMQEQHQQLIDMQHSRCQLSAQHSALQAQVDYMRSVRDSQERQDNKNQSEELRQLQDRHIGLQEQHSSLAMQVQLLQQTLASQMGQTSNAAPVPSEPYVPCCIVP